MWEDKDWNGFFRCMSFHFDVIPPMWRLMEKHHQNYVVTNLKVLQIVARIGLDVTNIGQRRLVCAAIHRMEDEGLIRVDRTVRPHVYELNPYAIRKWRNNCKGRIELWRKNHPGCDDIGQCVEDLGISRPTVRKWW